MVTAGVNAYTCTGPITVGQHVIMLAYLYVNNVNTIKYEKL
jgi:hypothetical protein